MHLDSHRPPVTQSPLHSKVIDPPVIIITRSSDVTLGCLGQVKITGSQVSVAQGLDNLRASEPCEAHVRGTQVSLKKHSG